MVVWMMGAVAFAGAGVELDWKGAHSHVKLIAPAGEHVSEEAPATLELAVGARRIRWEASGAELAEGVPAGPVAGEALSGTLSAAFCEDAGTRCRSVVLAVEGQVAAARRGRILLEGHPAAHAEAIPVGVDPEATVAEARALATAEDRLVLLDFGAIWCPPCNQLAAELLHADPPAESLDAWAIAGIDADDQRSWTLKDRYAVGGYPTLVATAPDGTELDRLVGYPGREATLAWLDGVAARRAPSPASPEGLSPAEAATEGRRRAEAGEHDLEPWLAAAEGAEGVDVHVLRFLATPTLADARWLHAWGIPTLAWGPAALDVDDAALLAEVHAAALEELPLAAPAVGADLTWLLGRCEPEAEARWAAVGAALLGSLRTRDPSRDRWLLTSYAGLLADAGQPDAGMAVLAEARLAFPRDPTWLLALAGIQLDEGLLDDALASTEAGMALAWDDNRLRMAALRVRVLLAMDRGDEARALVAAVLAEPAPDSGLAVRTHRYRAALEALVGAGE